MTMTGNVLGVVLGLVCLARATAMVRRIHAVLHRAPTVCFGAAVGTTTPADCRVASHAIYGRPSNSYVNFGFRVALSSVPQ
jgi:hypothetical protein